MIRRQSRERLKKKSKFVKLTISQGWTRSATEWSELDNSKLRRSLWQNVVCHHSSKLILERLRSRWVSSPKQASLRVHLEIRMEHKLNLSQRMPNFHSMILNKLMQVASTLWHKFLKMVHAIQPSVLLPSFIQNSITLRSSSISRLLTQEIIYRRFQISLKVMRLLNSSSSLTYLQPTMAPLLEELEARENKTVARELRSSKRLSRDFIKRSLKKICVCRKNNKGKSISSILKKILIIMMMKRETRIRLMMSMNLLIQADKVR